MCTYSNLKITRSHNWADFNPAEPHRHCVNNAYNGQGSLVEAHFRARGSVEGMQQEYEKYMQARSSFIKDVTNNVNELSLREGLQARHRDARKAARKEGKKATGKGGKTAAGKGAAAAGSSGVEVDCGLSATGKIIAQKTKSAGLALRRCFQRDNDRCLGLKGSKRDSCRRQVYRKMFEKVAASTGIPTFVSCSRKLLQCDNCNGGAHATAKLTQVLGTGHLSSGTKVAARLVPTSGSLQEITQL